MSAVAAKLEELERLRDVRKREIDVASASLEHARRELQAAEDVWGAHDGRPLPFAPLAAALCAVLCANVAAFSGWIVVLSRWHELFWGIALLLSVGMSLLALPFTKHEGAGGRARIGLRRVTIVLLVVALFETVIATERLFYF